LECKQYSKVTNIYERLIATPTHGYINNFERYYEFIIEDFKMHCDFYVYFYIYFYISFIFISSFKDYVKKYPKNKILETVQFLELRKEVLAEIKEAEAKKNHDRQIDSGSDSDDMADPMEQVIYII